MGMKDNSVRNMTRGESFGKGLDRIEKINERKGNPHDKWKEQIISDIIILAIFIGLVIYIFTR